jgi:galactose-1-phosphate uridylyltransferase
MVSSELKWHTSRLGIKHLCVLEEICCDYIGRSQVLKYLAGSESAMGAFIMDLRPEQSAAQLREVVL